MSRRPHFGFTRFACIVVALVVLAPATHAGFTDALKKKVTDLAGKQPTPTADKPASGDSAAAKPAAGTGGSGGTGGKVSAVSTKFDFVPGDSVMFLDDFKQDDLGEFPARWRLAEGTFEVAEMSGERWLRCTSADGRVRMKLPAMAMLPEFWTLEFDFSGEDPMGSALTVRALGNSERMVWEAAFPVGTSMTFRTGTINSNTPYEGEGSVSGRHHVMFMARGTAIKAYVDRQRMASVPEISTTDGAPATIELRLWAPTRPMITNVRFAEGCRPPKDMLAKGKLVTYGIRFESGSDVVQPESAPVLRQVASYLEANPQVRLEIIGHTDNVGAAASNLDLSKRRAAAVASVLTSEFKIAGDRLKTDGKGDTQSVAGNTTPEGRAMNRRVEFVKL